MLDTGVDVVPAMAIGVQRGPALLVRLFHDGSLQPEDCFLRLAYTDGRVGTVEPAPSEVSALDPVEASLRAHRRGKGVPHHRIDFTFAPRSGRLVRAAFVKVRKEKRFEAVPWNKGMSLAHRIPRDVGEFRSHLAFKRRRHSDEETIYGSCCDVVRAYLHTPEAQALAPYLVNAFVIATYKAVAIEAASHEVMALEADIHALIDSMSPSKAMRSDREIARLSVYTALWHYAVHTGDRALFERAMQGVEAVSRLDREQHPTFAYNATKSLLLYGLLTSFDDVERAHEIFDLVYERFRAAAASRTSNTTQLRELRVGLEASALAVGAMRQIRSGGPIAPGMGRAVIEVSPRVDTPAFIKRLKKMIIDRRHNGRAVLAPALAMANDNDDGDDFEGDDA